MQACAFAWFKKCLKINQKQFIKICKNSGNFVCIKLQYQEPKSTRTHQFQYTWKNKFILHFLAEQITQDGNACNMLILFFSSNI